MVDQKLSYAEFFKYFPESYFCITDFAKEGIVESAVIYKEGEPSPDKEDFETTKKLNRQGCSVFFTPNAVKTKEGKHSLANFNYVNACYIDIDIEETKECITEEDFKLRQQEKEILAGHIMFSPLPPSLTVETRNGFQIYWFTSCDLATFKKAQKGILDYFKPFGGDPATIKEVQLLRVPGYFHDKEPFLIKIRWDLCDRYDDGSFKFHKINSIQEAYPTPEPVITIHKIGEKTIKEKPFNMYRIFKHAVSNDIFKKVLALPVLEVMRKMSGTRLTGGEILEFLPERNGKIQIRVNGESTPNFINISENLIFAKGNPDFCNPIHYAEWYNLTKAEIAEEFKKIFA